MSTTFEHRYLTPIERDVVLTELRAVLSSTHFCNSRRYPALLKYVVEQTLAGHEHTLKERTIGVEVFDRPVTYDTYADAVVRFTAGEVRKRLAAYYHELPRTSGIRISLPLGTYVPDFHMEVPEYTQEPNPEEAGVAGSPEAHPPVHLSERIPSLDTLPSFPEPPGPTISPAALSSETTHRRWIAILAGILAVIALLMFYFFHSHTTLDKFWRPFLQDSKTVLICAGGNALSSRQNNGFITAGKDTAYPYFSLQTIQSVSQLSSFLQKKGSTPLFNFAASTSLPELDSHSIILLNAYNNPWTLRLVEPLRFHFSADTGSIPNQSIIDRDASGVQWKRDSSSPDSDTSDYALIARFWDTVTDHWILVLAGLGKNGTEAAAQFVTNPHYVELLHDRTKFDVTNANVEIVIKVNVIDGKSGPPSIVATQTW